MRKETEYAYSAARVKVMEKSLLTADKLNQMIDAKSESEVLKLVAEAGYPVGENADYEQAFAKELRRICGEISAMTPGEDIVKIFRLKDDYHNLKCLIKAEHLNIDCMGMLAENGTVGAEKMADIYRRRAFDELNDTIMSGAVGAAMDRFNAQGDPQAADMVLDGAQYRDMLENAKAMENDFAVRLVKLYSDMNNLRTFVRVRRTGRDKAFLKQAILNTGNIGTEVFENLMDRTVAEAAKELAKYYKNAKITTALFDPENKGMMSELERYSDNSIVEYIRSIRRKAFGIEPVIGYYLAKVNETANIRIILVGKANGIDSAIIRERVRSVYV